MEKRFMLALTAIAVAGCSGGDSDDDAGPGGGVNPIGRPSLVESIDLGLGGIDSPNQETLFGDSSDVEVTQDYDVRVEIDGRRVQTWRDNSDFVDVPLPAGLELYATDDDSDFLFISRLGTNNDRLDYAAFGLWALTDTPNVIDGFTATRVEDAAPFYIGVRTAPNDMPRFGTALYEGDAVGGEFVGDELFVLTGAFEALADFERGTIDALIRLDEADRPWGVIEAETMPISGSRFGSGSTGAFSDLGHVGEVEGAFYGIRADEVAGSFRLYDDRIESTVLGAYGGED